MSSSEGGEAPIRLVEKLRRKKDSLKKNACLVEGWKCLREAKEVFQPQSVLIAEDCCDKYRSLYGWKKNRDHSLPERTMKSLCETLHPEGVLAIFPRPEVFDNFPSAQAGELHLLLDQWRDPGGVGTVVRSARGLGVCSVSLWENGPDFFSPRVIRGSMGSVFHMRLALIQKGFASEENWNIFFADAQGLDSSKFKLDSKKPNLLVIGSEANGFSESISVNKKISIHLHGGLESLGAPTAAAILMDRLQTRV